MFTQIEYKGHQLSETISKQFGNSFKNGANIMSTNSSMAQGQYLMPADRKPDQTSANMEHLGQICCHQVG